MPDAKVRKPSLPKGVDWSPETRKWYRAWSRSPATDAWDERQWQYMLDTALVHNMVYGYSDMTLIGELRTRLAFMGLSFDSRPAPAAPGKREATTLELIRGRREAKARRAGA